jgi:hypothetical protein
MITALLAILISGFALAPPDHLIKYSSKTVRLYTDIEKREAKAVLDEIAFYESFIDDFFDAYGIAQKKSNPIRIYLYRERGKFMDQRSREFNINEPGDAYFSPGNNRIVAAYNEGSDRSFAALRRQCTRQIVRRYFTNPAPAWFEEGFACYFEGLAFDEYRNVVSTCNPYARFGTARYMANRGAFVEWDRFFDERPLPLDEAERVMGANNISPDFSAQAWAVVFFYLEAKDEKTRALFERFIKGLNTGRGRSIMIMEDLLDRGPDFYLFFQQDLQEIYDLFTQAVFLKEREKYPRALREVMKILMIDENHVAALRLAAETAWEAGTYEASLSFWKRLADLDAKESEYRWRICRCLVESGKRSNNPETLKEAVEAGKLAVNATRLPDPDSLASLAMAYHASAKFQDALATMRKATSLGGDSYDEYKQLEKQYSDDLRAHYRTK